MKEIIMKTILSIFMFPWAIILIIIVLLYDIYLLPVIFVYRKILKCKEPYFYHYNKLMN